MKPLSTRNIALIALVAVVVLAVGVFAVQNRPQEPEEVGEDPEISPIEPSLVTEVDMNMENWQTKETEFFTIKYPKEWYWMGGATLGILMTNDPVFSPRQDETGIPSVYTGAAYVKDSNQVMLVARSWSPYDAYNRENEEVGVIEFTKKYYIDNLAHDSEQCEYIQGKSDFEQSIVKCHRLYQERNIMGTHYLSVTERRAIYFTFVTTPDTVINEEIFDLMMRSVVRKD